MNFPKTVYVKIEDDGEDNFLVAGAALSDISESEDTIEVGVYELTTIKKAVNKTELID